MDKQCTIIGCSTIDRLKHAIDWSLCVICQKTSHKQALVCPVESKLRKTGDGYLTLESDLLGFESVNSLPSTVNLNLLNDGSGIGNTLRENRGRWHKSCRDALNSTKLERARKRKLEEITDATENNTVQQSVEQQAVYRSCTRAFLAHSASTFDDKCFFCESCNDTEKLWQVRTLGVDSRVRECASVLNDVHLLSKLSEGDLIAREAKYHARCLVAFYNRASRVGSADSESTGNNSVQSSSIALAELIAYIEDVRSNETIAPVFRLSELMKLYVSRLNQLGVAHDAREHSTRLKQRIMNHFPDMIEVCAGRGKGTNLMFDEDLSITLSKACKSDSYADAMHLVRAAQIIRRDTIDNGSKYSFQGTFSSDCQKDSVPASLLTLVSMILEGPCIDEVGLCEQSTAAALSISQLRVDENKTELFHLLSSVITENEITGKLILSTAGGSVLSCPTICTDSLSPCSHEEADTRMLLHAADAAKTLKHVMIRTVDTDVVVLAVAFFEQLHLDTLWIAFGLGKNFHYIAAHDIAVALGTKRSSALPVFHALTGCDTVSSFYGRGKSTTFDTWTSGCY